MSVTTLSPIRLGKSSPTKSIASLPTIILNQPKKSKAKAVKFATVTTALLGSTLVATGILAPVGAVILSSTIPALAVEFLAPKTFEKVINVRGGTQVLAATAAGGAIVGAVVGAEQGTSFLQEAGLSFGQAAGVTALAIGGAAVGGLAAKDLLTTSSGELTKKISKLEKQLLKEKKKSLEKAISAAVPATSQTPETAAGAVGSTLGSPELTPQTPITQNLNKSRRKTHKKKALEALHQTISQRVNVLINSNKKYIRNVIITQ